MKNHVFLSYSRQDALIMNRILDDLRERGLVVWADENSELTTVQNAIANAGSFVALLSPEAKQSESVKRELDYALARNIRIFPVLIHSNEYDSVPTALVGTEYINLVQPVDYEHGIEQLYDILAKHLGIKSRLEANELETSLLELGEKLTGATNIGLVNVDGQLLAVVNCVFHTAGQNTISKQAAPMIATLTGLSEKLHQRMSMNDFRYLVTGSTRDMMLAIYFERNTLVILFDDIVPIDSLLATIQRSIQPLLDVLEVKTEVKF
jgi:predicted regulator of Ras-like GTPase activity (Roadblock/LC7/MglB family)